MSTAVLLALLLQAPPVDGPADAARKAVAWMEEADAEVRAMGRQSLCKLGLAAVPFIEERLREKDAFDLASTLWEILGRAPSEETRWVEDVDLPVEEDLLGEPSNIEKHAVEQYVRARAAEAVREARRCNYQKGYDISHALLTLEPKSALAEQLRKVRRHCDNMTLQTTILEARLSAVRPSCTAGEKVELVLRFRNVFKEPLTVRFEGGVPGKAVVEIGVSMPEPRGSVTEFTRSDEVELGKELLLLPGQDWEKKFILDTSVESDLGEGVRVYTVNAWTLPGRIEFGGAPMTRRIQLRPVVVRTVAAPYAKFLDDPLEWLGKNMDTGTVQEVFVCAMLLEGEAKEKGTDLLVRALGKSETLVGRNFIGQLLTFMTGKKLGDDPARWTEWWESKKR